ncbi:MAG: hypothetical protein KBD46_02800 [Candidatus Levybacteria bacterium]|nr:hypothetical protein [Candidatus Levybacteria bacterium]
MTLLELQQSGILGTIATISQIIAVGFLVYLFVTDKKSNSSPRKSTKK